jgi:hypothetical protein
MPISIADSSVLSTPTLSVKSISSSSDGTFDSSVTTSSVSEVTQSSFPADQPVESTDESEPFTISSGIFSRPKMTLNVADFKSLLNKKWTLGRFNLYLSANFPSFFTIKTDYLDKISQAAKKTKTNEVHVRFEDIEDHVPFLSTTIQPLLSEIIEGLRVKREVRIEKCSVKEKDHPHRTGFLSFIQVVWQGLGNDDLI